LKISDSEAPMRHTYSLLVIQVAIVMATQVGISFRAVSKVFVTFNLYFQISLGTPSHTTVMNWTKKLGMAHIRGKAFYAAEKWVLVVDESIQFGNKKLLLAIAFPEKRVKEGGSLSFKDITPVMMQVSESWKSNDIADAIKASINPEQISYVISDEGSNLLNGIKSLSCKHIPDVNHRFSLIVKNIYENDAIFIRYTKELASMRAKLSMSKYARIVPPNQRIMSRFMNLKPLFEWGVKMLELMDGGALSGEEMEKLAFMNDCRSFVVETFGILCTLEKIQFLLKNEGFNKENAVRALHFFERTHGSSVRTVKEKVSCYFQAMQLTSKGKTVYCSSDIIESCFGKHKALVKSNKSVGISDLCLCIAAIMGSNDLDDTKAAMENKKIKQIEEWRKEKIPITLFAQKRDLMKKCGGIYS
jgi:hypothetical protein